MVDTPISKLPAAGTLVGSEVTIISQLSTTVKIAATTLSALASDNSFNDSGSGFIAAGFAVDDYVNVSGFTGNTANNIYSAKITALTAGKMTIGGTDGDVIVDDAAGESVTIAKWISRRTSASPTSSSYDGGPPTVPTVASCTWVNQGTAVATDGARGILIANDVDSELHMLVKAVPAAPFNFYVRLEVFQLSTSVNTTDIFDDIGIVLRDGVNGDLLHLCFRHRRIAGDEQNVYQATISRYANATTPGAAPVDVYMLRPIRWMRANVTSTTVTFYVSENGLDWVQVGTETIATFVGAITQYGIGVRSNATTASHILISYFSTTAPV